MTGRLAGVAPSGATGKHLVTIELDQDVSAVFSALQGQTVEVEIRRRGKRRSLDANAYFWVLAGKLAAKLGTSPEEIYRSFLPDIGGNYEAVSVSRDGADKLREAWGRSGKGWLSETVSEEAGFVTLLLYYGSSVYDTAQMARLIDWAVQACRENGIETLPPGKLAALKEDWGRRGRG